MINESIGVDIMNIKKRIEKIRIKIRNKRFQRLMKKGKLIH